MDDFFSNEDEKFYMIRKVTKDDVLFKETFTNGNGKLETLMLTKTAIARVLGDYNLDTICLDNELDMDGFLWIPFSDISDIKTQLLHQRNSGLHTLEFLTRCSKRRFRYMVTRAYVDKLLSLIKAQTDYEVIYVNENKKKKE